MRFSKAVVKYRVAILIVALALLAPAVLGMVNTRINYGQYILGKPANGLGNRAIYQPAAS